MTAVDIEKVVIFDGQATAGAWGTVIRAFAPWSDKFGALQPCGSVAAYQRHMYRNEDACPPCNGAVKRARDERRAGGMGDREQARPLAPHELWRQAGGDPQEYRRLMREHGHLVPGTPQPLPCGWPRDLPHAEEAEL